MGRSHRMPGAACAAILALAAASGPAAAYEGAVDEANTLPFVVALQIDGKATCTGVVVKPRVVVTAAHCITDVDAKEIVVLAGDARIRSRRLVPHPDYPRDKTTYNQYCECWTDHAEHDIGVVQLPSDIRGPFPRMLTEELPQEIQRELLASGTMQWGTLRYLIRSRMPGVFTGDDLYAIIAGYGMRKLCAKGSKDPGCDIDGKRRTGKLLLTKACLGKVWCLDALKAHGGDSGGPLLLRNGTTYLLAGVLHGGSYRTGINHSMASTLRNAPFLRAQGAM